MQRDEVEKGDQIEKIDVVSRTLKKNGIFKKEQNRIRVWVEFRGGQKGK